MSTLQLVISGATPLVSALIAGLIALLVTRRQRDLTRESWVLDKRYDLYQGLHDAMADLVGFPDQVTRMAAAQDPVKMSKLIQLLHRLDLIAPADVKRAGGKLYPLCWVPVRTDEDFQKFVDAVNAFLGALEGELVPEQMR